MDDGGASYFHWRGRRACRLRRGAAPPTQARVTSAAVTSRRQRKGRGAGRAPRAGGGAGGGIDRGGAAAPRRGAARCGYGELPAQSAAVASADAPYATRPTGGSEAGDGALNRSCRYRRAVEKKTRRAGSQGGAAPGTTRSRFKPGLSSTKVSRAGEADKKGPSPHAEGDDTSRRAPPLAVSL
ncbi:uncharacterized protein LOC126278855 [Schistocerca gregaria]|uniref:uncharacterized protein LOC126278855 n=1 Tax=Schistocerca gregaria TaxID=7010 RepID=UPI00211DC22D|nr:uncharacterized protein LOC126278855 [Schistocerca gregaria]